MRHANSAWYPPDHSMSDRDSPLLSSALQEIPMRFINLGDSPRISRLLDLTRTLRQCRTPNDALLMYCRFLSESFPQHAQVILASRGLPEGQYRVWRLRTD